MLAVGGVILLGAAASGMFSRSASERAVARQWDALVDAGPGGLFDPATLAGLPEPARRWLLHAIAPGTPLSHTALLKMRGSITLREGEEPWLMRAEQVLSPPRGFIWKAEVGSGLMRIRGFDRYVEGRGELRWWLLGLVPVVSADGPDVSRSAAGRLGGEAAMVPASLLPGTGVRWEAVPGDSDAARATMEVDDEDVSFTIHVAADGRLRQVVIRRWNGDPDNGAIGFLPFVVDFEGERVWGGYTTPAHLRAGWERDGQVHVFFDAEVTDIVYR